MRCPRIPLLTLALLACLPVAGASAATADLAPREVTAQRGVVTSLSLQFDGAASCDLRVGPSTLTFSATGLESARALLPKALLQGRARPVPVTLACDDESPVTGRVIVPRTIRARAASAAPPAAPALVLIDKQRRADPVRDAAHALADAEWAAFGADYISGFHSGISLGQCTDWAATKRPDIVERSYEAESVAVQLGEPAPTHLGDALTWAPAARDAGMAVSSRPAVGAVVVWQPGVEGAGPPGHLGYVESVSPDGTTFTTSEMHVGGLGAMGTRTLSTRPVAGREFILG